MLVNNHKLQERVFEKDRLVGGLAYSTDKMNN